MGVLNRGILGGFRGKVGPVIGTSWKGIDVMKSKPLSVANPRTPGQVAQRQSFASAVLLGSQILVDIVKPFWDRFAQKMSGFNAFVQSNVELFDSAGVLTVPADLVVSKGKLAVLDTFAIDSITNAGQISLSWSDVGGFSTDEISILAYNEDKELFEAFPTAAVRAGITAGITLTMNFDSGDLINVYAAARRVDGTEVSNTSVDSQVVAV